MVMLDPLKETFASLQWIHLLLWKENKTASGTYLEEERSPQVNLCAGNFFSNIQIPVPSIVVITRTYTKSSVVTYVVQLSTISMESI